MFISAFPAVLRPADVPVVPGADEARRWAQEELAKKVYQDAKPGWADQLFAALKKALAELLNTMGVANANVGLAVVVGLVLLAAVAIVLIIRPRLNRRKAASDAVFGGEQALSSEQHRTMARTAARSGDFHAAVSEQFRAMVRAAEERAVSAPALGLTAAEIVAVLEHAFPAHRQVLLHSAELFNAVRYGRVPPTAAMYEELLATDAALAATTPQYADDFTVVHP